MKQPIDLSTVTLEAGAHASGTGYCIEELVAALAGEPWTDAPACVSQAIAAYCRVLNDRWPHSLRQRLISYAAVQIGTYDERDPERAYLCADAAVRVFAPLALEAAGYPEDAAHLRALPEIVDRETAALAATCGAAAAIATDAAFAAEAAAIATDAAFAAAAAIATDAAFAAEAAALAALAAADAAALADAAAIAALALLERLCALGREVPA